MLVFIMRVSMVDFDNCRKVKGCSFLVESLLSSIDKKKSELDLRQPLTDGEVEWLSEEFVVEYTYNSNANRQI